VYIVGALFLPIRFKQTNRNYSTTIDLFAAAANNNLCIA